MALDRQSSPTISVRPTILVSRTESTNPNEILIRVLVLYAPLLSVPDDETRRAHLSVLSRYFDFVELRVLKLDQVMAEIVQRLHSWASIEQAFVLISPLLKFTNVLLQTWFALDEVLLIVPLQGGQ